MSIFELIVTVFVIALVLFAMWRVGQLNPVGTGRLARRMTELEAQVTSLDGRIEGIEKSVTALAEAGAATHKSVEAMRIELASDRGVTERTWESVNRLQLFFMDEGLNAIAGR